MAISRHNTEATLTLSTAMTLNSSYTVTMKNLTTASGDQLPATQHVHVHLRAADLDRHHVPGQLGHFGQPGPTPNRSSTSAADQSWAQAFSPTTLNFTTGNSTGLGHFTNDTLMPTQTSLSEDLTISSSPRAPTSTSRRPATTRSTSPATTASSLTIPGVTFTTLTNATNSTGSDQMQYNGSRGTADTLGVADFPAAGYYPLSVLYFNGGGPGSLELSAAAGSYTAWTSAFELVGNSTDGGLALGGAMVDTTTPPAPANLHATVTGNNTQIALAWSPVTGLPSGVDHYNIYRNGSLYATSTTTSFTDTSGISSQSRYSYQVAAVNYDGVAGLLVAPRQHSPRGHRLDQHSRPRRRSWSSSPSPSTPPPRRPRRTMRSAASRSSPPCCSRTAARSR